MSLMGPKWLGLVLTLDLMPEKLHSDAGGENLQRQQRLVAGTHRRSRTTPEYAVYLYVPGWGTLRKLFLSNSRLSLSVPYHLNNFPPFTGTDTLTNDHVPDFPASSARADPGQFLSVITLIGTKRRRL